MSHISPHLQQNNKHHMTISYRHFGLSPFEPDTTFVQGKTQTTELCVCCSKFVNLYNLQNVLDDLVNVTTTSVTIRCISKASKVIQKNVKIP